MKLIFEVFAVIGGERGPAMPVGEFEDAEGARRSVARAHLLMRGHPEVEHVLVYNTAPARGVPRYIGLVRRDARRIVRH